MCDLPHADGFSRVIRVQSQKNGTIYLKKKNNYKHFQASYLEMKGN